MVSVIKMYSAVLVISVVVSVAQVECQFWNFPKEIYDSFSWLRQGKTGDVKITTSHPSSAVTIAASKIFDKSPSEYSGITRTSVSTKFFKNSQSINDTRATAQSYPRSSHTTPSFVAIVSPQTTFKTTTKPGFTTMGLLTSTSSITKRMPSSKTITSVTTVTEVESSTLFDTTIHDVTGTTEEPRDNQRTHEFYLSKREKPQVKISSNISQNLLPLPAGASAALVKPTKYHYYPHNQHIYLLPECAIQQVCNAVYVRLNWTQPLCACPSRYRDPCSASLNSDDQHTTELLTDPKRKRALTLVKTCEPTTEMRLCRIPRDWSLLALQNVRTGKSHYLVICRCPDSSILEGPMSHDQPTYASVPGIRVYGMMCVQGRNQRDGRPLRIGRTVDKIPPFPWDKLDELLKSELWN